MSKTKTPFFGLDAHGSVGGSITAQGLPKETLIRTKPLPTYRYTLPQAYQRWLYEDYAYRWRQQTDAVKSQHRTAGVPYHLTAFQYWMKYNLQNLPDIAALWHLDTGQTPIATDFSKNANHGTVIGASPATGLIDGALYFDGLNDRVTVLHTPSLIPDPLSFEALVIPTSFDLAYNTVVSKEGPTSWSFTLMVRNNGKLAVYLHRVAGWISYDGTGTHTLTPGNTYHLAFTWERPTLTGYVNGIVDKVVVANFATDFSTDNLVIGATTGQNRWWKGIIDNPILYNRALDPTEIETHSLRRYPP